jgi:hypothetical protein
LGAARPAAGYDFEVTSRTEGYAYQLRRYGQDGIQLWNRRRLTQYLGLRIFNLLGTDGEAIGSRPGRLLPLVTFHALMRLSTDFGSFADSVPVVPEVENNQLDLMVAALEGRNLWGMLDFAAGRQIDMEALDFFAFDGLKVRVTSPWHLYLEAYAGTQVAGAHPFSSAVFETDGASGDRSREAWSPTFGLATGIDDVRGAHVRAAYRGLASKATPATHGAGGSGDSLWGVDQEVLFLGAGIDLPWLRLRPQLALRYDLLTAQVDDLQASAVLPLAPELEAQLEYLRSRPHFDGDSIFNIFTLEPFSAVSGRATLRLWSQLSLSARLGYRWFWAAEAEGPDVERSATSLGCVVGWRRARVHANLEAHGLLGREGTTMGADLDGGWTPRRFVTLEGRLSAVRLYDSTHRDKALFSFGVQAGALFRLVRGVRLLVLLEDNVSRLYASALRLLGVLDMEFAP